MTVYLLKLATELIPTAIQATLAAITLAVCSRGGKLAVLEVN